MPPFHLDRTHSDQDSILQPLLPHRDLSVGEERTFLSEQLNLSKMNLELQGVHPDNTMETEIRSPHKMKQEDMQEDLRSPSFDRLSLGVSRRQPNLDDEPGVQLELQDPSQWDSSTGESELSSRTLLKALEDVAMCIDEEIAKSDNPYLNFWPFAVLWRVRPGIVQRYASVGYLAAMDGLLKLTVKKLEGSSNTPALLSLLCILDLLESSMQLSNPNFHSSEIALKFFAQIEKVVNKDPHLTEHAVDTEFESLILAVHIMGTLNSLVDKAANGSKIAELLNLETAKILVLLVELVPIDEVYARCQQAGLAFNFLTVLGSRSSKLMNKSGRRKPRVEFSAVSIKEEEERRFWVQTVEEVVVLGLKEEKICGTLQNLSVENDLAVFGVFAVLGKSTFSYLNSMGVNEVDEDLLNLVRYLEGGSVIFFPELRNLLRYQLFLEVVAESMSWLPFYPEVKAVSQEKPPMTKRHVRQAMQRVQSTLERWIVDFRKLSWWIKEHSSGIAAQFLRECVTRLLHLKLSQARKHGIEMSGPATSDSESTDSCYQDDLDNDFDQKSEEFELENFKSDNGQESVSHDFSNSEIQPDTTENPLFPRMKESPSQPEISEDFLILPSGSFPRRSISMESHSKMSTFNETTVQSEISGWSLLSISTKKKSSFLDRSLERLAETTASTWRGVKLFFTDMAAAASILQHGLLRRSLTKRQISILGRTVLDVATIVPISIIMIIPLTPVGHAAVLAGIKRWIPGLIPSSFQDERLETARQLEFITSTPSTSSLLGSYSMFHSHQNLESIVEEDDQPLQM